MSFFSLPTSLMYFIIWNDPAPTGFITEYPAQWLSKFLSFKNYFSEDVQKGFFFVSCLTGMIYSKFSNKSRISNIYNDHRPLSILLGFYLVFSYLVNLDLLIVGFGIVHLINKNALPDYKLCGCCTRIFSRTTTFFLRWILVFIRPCLHYTLQMVFFLL